MNVEMLSEAEEEFLDAIDFYNNRSEGLGYEFAAEVQATIERILQFSEAWANLSKRAQRCRCERFPYGLIYEIRKDTILIVSVMHLHKGPNSWKDRT